ncbi:MAG: trypsin-like peptidase domain-containing protein [Spirochaetales bacterium]|nr:trypsin-like peptidase domain-containing protein [Spirochaetales bacterium]
MKLYSRWQLVLYSIGAVVAVLAVLLTVGLLRAPGREDGDAGRVSSEAGEPAVEPAVELEIPLPAPFGDSEIPGVTGRPVQYSGSYSADEANNIQVYERLNPAVVNITSVSFEYNWFLEPVPREGTGSGSIIDAKGHVLTNYHVIKDAEELSVTLADGENFKGTIVGVDRENDLAVIRFDPEGRRLTVIPLGTSEDLRVGQKVLAIGNPFALDRTLTTGIVSGLGRPVRSDSGIVIREMIQTDASINPGNSGGPLLNARGEMIGINTMIYSPSGGSVGIGFAVPVDTARRVLPDLLRFGKVQRGWIDIVPVQLFPALVRYGNLPVAEGILVSEVASGSSAEKAGLRGGDQPVRYGRSTFRIGGDIIVEVDRSPVATFADLLGALEDNKPGETVSVRVVRGRRQLELSVKLSERPQNLRW